MRMTVFDCDLFVSPSFLFSVGCSIARTFSLHSFSFPPFDLNSNPTFAHERKSRKHVSFSNTRSLIMKTRTAAEHQPNTETHHQLTLLASFLHSPHSYQRSATLSFTETQNTTRPPEASVARQCMNIKHDICARVSGCVGVCARGCVCDCIVILRVRRLIVHGVVV